ncbi:hypothetical protein QBC34DRAFT_300250 [Podospora aff. communis PSN243]|uniref:Uncharacterized protein n=1 Tax=Podospora aff. communis PSN243 TaxID=3040156 RepID=A0AAV9GNP1_9PEZI|nr:hypothetical protein QBC34DRAFT_300250 [Podospora aff. communis PSN243]
MIAKGDQAYNAKRMLDIRPGPPGTNPSWCFDRFGRTTTWLEDGRIVFIGGEHEDWYDPDFCIYNDVVVVSPAEHPEVVSREVRVPREEDDWEGRDWEDYYGDEDEDEGEEDVWILVEGLEIKPPRPGEMEIHGYPASVFPPTDGHVAVYVEKVKWREYIYIIGGVGYTPGVHREATRVFRLYLKDFSIKPLATTGELPPHDVDAVRGRKAQLAGQDIVTTELDGERYALCLKTLVWRKLSKVAAPTPAEYVEEQYCRESLPISEDIENGYL